MGRWSLVHRAGLSLMALALKMKDPGELLHHFHREGHRESAAISDLGSMFSPDSKAPRPWTARPPELEETGLSGVVLCYSSSRMN